MDWKRHYADELAEPAGRAAVLDALQRHASGDAAVVAALRAGGWASFPHVSLRDSADALARVATSVLHSGCRRVLALGVLHGGTLPLPARDEWLALHAGAPQAEALFPRFAGAFFQHGALATPFGRLEEGPLPAVSALVREDAALLQGEFSLDLFSATLAAAAQVQGVRPPPVTRLFVGAMRSPAGGFEAARALADEIRALIDDGTACVTTGDLAHIGHGYGPDDETARLPADMPTLLAAVREGITAQYHAALAKHDFEAAWQTGSQWRNDQRQILPLIAELLGAPARFELLALALSDYAAINGVPAPCCVAAALGLFVADAAARPQSAPIGGEEVHGERTFGDPGAHPRRGHRA